MLAVNLKTGGVTEVFQFFWMGVSLLHFSKMLDLSKEIILLEILVMVVGDEECFSDLLSCFLLKLVSTDQVVEDNVCMHSKQSII